MSQEPCNERGLEVNLGMLVIIQAEPFSSNGSAVQVNIGLRIPCSLKGMAPHF